MRASRGAASCFIVAALIVFARENKAFCDPEGRAEIAPASGSAALAGAQSLRLDQCVATALQNNVDVRTANAEVDVKDGERAEVRGQFLPKLHVDGYVQQWTEAYNIPFALTPGQPPVNFPVHDAFQWNATVSLTQPITGLFVIYEAYKVRDLGVDVAQIEREAQRRDTAFDVVQNYYRLLQAERLTEVAAASVAELQQQLKQSNSFHTNGVVSQDDVLRAELAVANAQQRLIQSRARVTLTRSSLAVAMGMPPDAAIEAVPRASDELPPLEKTSLSDAQRMAESGRVEIRELDKRIESAHRDKKIAVLKLAPQVNVTGAYIHNEGSLFSQTNSAYVGAFASWDAWDWGTTAGGISAAKGKEEQALLARKKVADHIRLDVEQAFVGLETATEAMTVARASVAAAEENFRLVKTRYAASAATSFDVVDAESLLTQARGQLQTGLYDFMIAHAALRRAVGAQPEALARD
jgi:outer membrane protein